jgi:UDP-2,3-diacylglucosamine pyrophosphatase LpxH
MSTELVANDKRKNIGKHLFTVAILADTHVTEQDGKSNSPFLVNKMANARLSHVIGELNHNDHAFCIHLGDLVHPVPAVLNQFEQAVACFNEKISRLKSKIYLVPGNHDVGDKPNEWGPAGTIKEEYIDLWTKNFGSHYQVIKHEDCHFILLNAQILNTGLPAELEQRIWLESYLQQNAHARIFISIHYPPYLLDRAEGEHYDNIAEPGRSWLLELLEKYHVEALFAGHVHHFWYHKHVDTDCYLLPSTAFVRQDYSDVFRIAPDQTMQFGRDDAQKLGYALLAVHEHGHVCHLIRTEGHIDDQLIESNTTRKVLKAPHPRESAQTSLGFDMRQDWLEHVEITPTGGLDEFDRKTVRNDYPLMALWEMGVRKLRIPLSDLSKKFKLDRLYDLCDQGHELTLFTYGVPDQALINLVSKHRNLLNSWEITAPIENIRAVSAAVNLKALIGLPLFFSKLRTKEDAVAKGSHYYHVINHGFNVTDKEELEKLFSLALVKNIFSGVVFRVGSQQSAVLAIQQAAQLSFALDIVASIHIRMGSENPAQAMSNEHWTANRVAEATAAALAYPKVNVFVDTMADIDRGYFPRLGVVDKMFNPRLGYYVVRHLNALFACVQDQLVLEEINESNNAMLITLTQGIQKWWLILPNSDNELICLEPLIREHLMSKQILVFNLRSGAHCVFPTAKYLDDGLSLLFGKARAVPLLVNQI